MAEFCIRPEKSFQDLWVRSASCQPQLYGLWQYHIAYSCHWNNQWFGGWPVLPVWTFVGFAGLGPEWSSKWSAITAGEVRIRVWIRNQVQFQDPWMCCNL